MLIPDQKIEMTWNGKNKQHYISCGYQFTKIGDSFYVKAEDLLPQSRKTIQLVCDCCGSVVTDNYFRYYNLAKHHGKYFCKSCIKKYDLYERQNKHYKQLIEFCAENNYELITKPEEIITVDSEVKYICPIHGIQSTTVSNMLQHRHCRQCGNLSKASKMNEYYKNNLENRQKTFYDKLLKICNTNGYTLLSSPQDIKNNTSYIQYSCPNHGQHRMQVKNMINGRICPDCRKEKSSQKYRLSVDEVNKRISECGGKWINKSEYVNNSTNNLRIICPRCHNNILTTSLQHFVQHGGQVCSECFHKESNGERRIRQYLDEKHIMYYQEHWFADCRDVKPLPFDFFLPEHDTVIEFDGIQHFKDTGYFHYSYTQNQKHDQIKNIYCSNHDIHLIRIPYTDFNKIESILEKEILHEDIV